MNRKSLSQPLNLWKVFSGKAVGQIANLASRSGQGFVDLAHEKPGTGIYNRKLLTGMEQVNFNCSKSPKIVVRFFSDYRKSQNVSGNYCRPNWQFGRRGDARILSQPFKGCAIHFDLNEFRWYEKVFGSRSTFERFRDLFQSDWKVAIWKNLKKPLNLWKGSFKEVKGANPGCPTNRPLSRPPEPATNSSLKCTGLVGQTDVCGEDSVRYFSVKQNRKYRWFESEAFKKQEFHAWKK